MRLPPRRLPLLAAAGVIAAALALTTHPDSGAAATAAATPPTAGIALPVGHAGTWLTDAAGRVVVLHGVNQVFKVPPYEPSAGGFGDDDAAFLSANGFDAVRVGVIWAAVEPQLGHYDDAYLASIADTVHTLAAHGIVSILDFHQDLYNEQFGGEGAPAWAVQAGLLPHLPLGFPYAYFADPAEDHAWDAFWNNAKASDGVGLQDHYAAAWAHVAAYFAGTPSVAGYDLMNEPWPGTVWEGCAVPFLGCPVSDARLTSFYRKVTAAIRTVDPRTMVWIEPNTLFGTVDATNLGTVADPNVGWSFHDYCATEAELQTHVLCPQLDTVTLAVANSYAQRHTLPSLMGEFGATGDLTNISEMVALADEYRLSWTEWAYTGNDKTSSSPGGQALVLDPAQPPTGANVDAGKLAALAEPYPQVVAGTPSSWSFTGGVFSLRYATARAAGAGRFPAGSITTIAVPAIQYPHGYTATVTGGHAVSAPGATVLQVAADPGAASVTVTLTPA